MKSKIKLNFAELEKELDIIKEIDLIKVSGGQYSSDCFTYSYMSVYNRIYGSGMTYEQSQNSYNSMYANMNMPGVGVYQNPAASGADSLVAYNLVANSFDNVSFVSNKDDIYNSIDNQVATFANLEGARWGGGHSVEFTQTRTVNGQKQVYMVDSQNSSETGWYNWSEIQGFVNSAFSIGEQDGYNQSTDYFDLTTIDYTWPPTTSY